MSDKPISAMIYAPVVSSDPNSPESKLARANTLIQAQSNTDSHYDTVLERFSGINEERKILMNLVLVAGFFLLSSLVQKRK
jgi:hypothetical protein